MVFSIEHEFLVVGPLMPEHVWKQEKGQLLLSLFDTVHPHSFPLSLFFSLADRRQWCAIGILLAILFVVVILFFILWWPDCSPRHTPTDPSHPCLRLTIGMDFTWGLGKHQGFHWHREMAIYPNPLFTTYCWIYSDSSVAGASFLSSNILSRHFSTKLKPSLASLCRIWPYVNTRPQNIFRKPIWGKPGCNQGRCILLVTF